MKTTRTHLSVNLNKIALLRNSRGGELPSPVEAARVCIAAGCDGLTLHPRPDLRHALPADVAALRSLCIDVEMNLEGNPFSPPSARYPGFMAMLETFVPEQATLVPDSDGQLTSDHGWDLVKDGERLRPLISRLTAAGMRVSLFMDMDSPDFARAADLGAQRVEFYTGPFAESFERHDAHQWLEQCASAAERAQRLGLEINAGHDLDQRNLSLLLGAVPSIREVSIGHALINEALYAGLAPTVAAYLALIRAVD